jgi:N-acetylglucosaminyl-diphospho-decaprenol L-rhamnosyltransferase
VDWVSGACFLVRRAAFEKVGGFDERYFMFAEDMALCWQLREHGYQVAATSDAVVTHIEGLSRSRVSREMLIAHHRSALRFEMQTARGWRRALVPVASLVLSLRLVLVLLARPKT